jgi:hypothetical protein
MRSLAALAVLALAFVEGAPRLWSGGEDAEVDVREIVTILHNEERVTGR